MDTNIEAKTDTDGDQFGGPDRTPPSSPSPSSPRVDSAPGVVIIPSNAFNEDAKVSAGAMSKDLDKCYGRDAMPQLWEGMDTTLSQLEYLNSEYSASIFTALEKVTEEFAVIIEELALLEGLLARKPGFDMRVFKRAKNTVTKHEERTNKMFEILEGVYAVEMVFFKCKIIAALFWRAKHEASPQQGSTEEVKVKGDDEATAASDDDIDDNQKNVEDGLRGPFTYPLASKLFEIIQELHRRTMALIEEVQRRAVLYLEQHRQTVAAADGEGGGAG